MIWKGMGPSTAKIRKKDKVGGITYQILQLPAKLRCLRLWCWQRDRLGDHGTENPETPTQAANPF